MTDECRFVRLEVEFLGDGLADYFNSLFRRIERCVHAWEPYPTDPKGVAQLCRKCGYHWWEGTEPPPGPCVVDEGEL